MAATNDVTGDSIQSRGASQAYKDNWDSIFKKKPKGVTSGQEDSGELCVPLLCSEGEGSNIKPSDHLRED